MPLDTSISNVGEYYSSHYLETTFAKDLKDRAAQWKEQGAQATPRRLQKLGQLYFRAKALALDVDEPADRCDAGDDIAGWHAHLLDALGYADRQPFNLSVEGGQAAAPVVTRINRYNKPWLVVCETFFCIPDANLRDGQPGEDPLELEPADSQLVNASSDTDPQQPNSSSNKTAKLCAGTWSRVIGRILTEEDAPRWVMLLAGSQVLLLDRNTFAQGRWLAFDLDDAFGRKDKSTFDHLAAFLSHDTLCPNGESDEVLHDRLEESSHRFAHGVTDKLQVSVRQAINLLVNEWVEDRRRRKLSYTKRLTDEILADGDDSITADDLKREALTFVYRLLFCFYAEARGGETNLLPIDDDAYRLGYSLESLRDLEQTPLTPQAESGTYFHQHLKQLFRLIHDGFRPFVPVGENVDTPSPAVAETTEAKRPEPTSTAAADAANYQRRLFDTNSVRTFTVRPLTATLFSPDTTPLLNKATLSNRCLQQVICKLSLSTDGRSKTAGRVNYAELGINQLGAVYEGLLSYQGMFADQDLIHVKPAGKSLTDKKTPSWFVPTERLDEFAKDEVERTDDGKPRIYPRGSFILHLNGIDREQSASYYTPEVLTQCLVQEALRELLKDYGPEDADRILELKICEPAMGSGAFLNEAAKQLAERYLELKQQQLQLAAQNDVDSTVSDVPPTEDRLEACPASIEPGRYADELRRVKHYITTRNVYGVDLNATAVELGALSLWLGCIHRLLLRTGENGDRDLFQSGATPWFGLRLRCGNSLIGARRAVWTKEQLKRGEHAWSAKQAKEAAEAQKKQETGTVSEVHKSSGNPPIKSVPSAKSQTLKPKTRNPKAETLFPTDGPREITPGVPRLLKPGEERREDEVYHFLVFDADMVPTHTDKLMRSFWPEACAAGKKWVVQEAKPKWKAEQIKEALQICDLIDQRWEAYGKQRDAALLRTACTATVWPEPGHTPAAVKPGPSLAEQEKEKADLESTSNSFQRLKLVMDAWCALWFWPLQRVADLPSRDAFLTSARLLLGAEPPKDKHLTAQMSLRLGFEVDGLLAGIGAGQIPDVEILSSNVPWYDLARTLSDEQNFHHWELVYPEVLGPHPERRGFDLIVGNPPWLKVTWSEAATLCELDAKLGVEEASAAALSKNQLRLLDNKTTRRFFGDAYRNATGGIACMKSMRMYGVLSTIQTNIYKCFILKAWDLLAPNGFAGLIYEDGVYDAPKGGALRELSFPRLRSHFQFRNELQLFPDVGHAKTFCLSVYAGTPRAPTFKTIANLFHPKSIEQCLSHRSATDPVPGIKSDDGNWETRGHISRVLCIDADALSLFNSVYEEEGGPWLQTRLPHIHSSELMSVLQKLTSPKKWLDRIRNDYHATEMFHETEAQRDGVITRASAPSFSPQLD